MSRWHVYTIEENFETLKFNNEDEGIDLSFGLDIEACIMEENATPLKKQNSMNHLNSFAACLLELNLVESSSSQCVWYLDSGMTHHITGNRSTFSSFDQKLKCEINMRTQPQCWELVTLICNSTMVMSKPSHMFFTLHQLGRLFYMLEI